MALRSASCRIMRLLLLSCGVWRRRPIQRGHPAPLPGLPQGLLQVGLDPGVFGKIALDKLAGQAIAHPQLLGQAEGAHAVNNPEINHLGLPAHIRAHQFRMDAEHHRRGLPVDVDAVLEGLEENGVLGEMGQNAQFHLGIIGAEKHLASLRHKGLANLPAQLPPNRDVL